MLLPGRVNKIADNLTVHAYVYHLCKNPEGTRECIQFLCCCVITLQEGVSVDLRMIRIYKCSCLDEGVLCSLHEKISINVCWDKSQMGCCKTKFTTLYIIPPSTSHPNVNSNTTFISNDQSINIIWCHIEANNKFV